MGDREMQVLVRACGSVVGLAMFVSASHAAAVAIRDRLSFESSRSAAPVQPAPRSTHESQELLNRESGSEEGENVALAEATEGGASGGDDRSDASSTVTMVPDATRFVFSFEQELNYLALAALSWNFIFLNACMSEYLCILIINLMYYYYYPSYDSYILLLE